MEGALRPGDPAALCSSCLGLVTVSKVLQLQGHLVGKMGGPEELKAGPPKDPRTLRLSFPIWTAEGCACPLLISLWNPRWGPLFGDDPSPKPSSCSPSHTLLPAPQPLTLAPPPYPHRPPDGFQQPPQSLYCLVCCGGRSLTLDWLAEAWHRGQCPSIASSATTKYL